MLRIPLPQVVELRDILADALEPHEMDAALLRLEVRRQRITMAGNQNQIYSDVIVYFNNRDTVDDLLATTRADNPTNAALYRFAQRHGLAAALPPEAAEPAGLEAIIRRHLRSFDARVWSERSAAAENCVCRISHNGVPLGTGFLVGPEAVLTNTHVARHFIDRGDPTGLEFRFDFMLLGDGQLASAAAPLGPVADDWLIDHSPIHPSDDPHTTGAPVNPPTPPDVPANVLDYALLRVAGQPGKAPVGGPVAPSGSARLRGWLRLGGAPFKFADSPSLIVLHHPRGTMLQISLDTDSFAHVNAQGSRVYHRSNTDEGSSGSPCFDLGWNLVALHQGSTKIAGERLNRAIPTAAIYANLNQAGRKALV